MIGTIITNKTFGFNIPCVTEARQFLAMMSAGMIDGCEKATQVGSRNLEDGDLVIIADGVPRYFRYQGCNDQWVWWFEVDEAQFILLQDDRDMDLHGHLIEIAR